jgi:flagellar protein FliO/FliZ
MFDSVLANFVLALATVIVLIGVLTYFVKRFGLIAGVSGKKSAGKRLGIIEVANVDAKRRLILVRRDATEHLILLGLDGDLLVEQGIPKGGIAKSPDRLEKAPEEDVPWMEA